MHTGRLSTAFRELYVTYNQWFRYSDPAELSEHTATIRRGSKYAEPA